MPRPLTCCSFITIKFSSFPLVSPSLSLALLTFTLLSYTAFVLILLSNFVLIVKIPLLQSLPSRFVRHASAKAFNRGDCEQVRLQR